ncbi:MAG: family 20 glycosylhydrolase [Bacteroidetes bacterium]|nr:family 20 glycosylhydrolase [Bacteroidota bacterium]
MNCQVFSQINIIPKPTSIVEKKGYFIVGKKITINVIADDKSIIDIVNPLLNKFSEKCKDGFFKSNFNSLSKSDNIVFQLDNNLLNLGDEGYKLSITTKKIHVLAYKKAGLFYALQSLRQLIPLETKEIKIPCVEIIDIPKFQWRGLLLDCGRHFMDKAFVKRYIDLLSYYKMNRLHWHLTEDQGWRIEIKKYPKLTEIGAWRTEADGSRYGGFYTQDDIREVVAYAATKFVTVVPEIEMPGHSVAAIASYPSLSCTGKELNVETQWGVFKDIYCAGNDSTFVFIKNVLTEVMALFPSKYIHIGGDEAPKFRWERCDKCQQRIKANGLKGEHELQSWFIGQIDDFLAQHGRKLIGWDEILEGGLSKGATVQSWRGMEGAVAAARSGHDAIVSPTSHAYFDYDIANINMEKVYNFNPLPQELSIEESIHILGGECNLWSEHASQEKVDERVFPRILAMSEVLWTYPQKRDYESFRARVQQHYPVLNAMGVTYGFERDPLMIKTKADYQKREISAILEKTQQGTDIYFSTNGKKADRTSTLYTNPIIAKDSLKLNITILAKGSETGIYYEREFKLHKATGKIPQLKNPYSKSYPAQGENSLTDGIMGTNAFRDGNWQGFEGDDMVVVIDMGAATSFSHISCGFLQSTPSWIFFPPQAEYFVSKNGIDFVSVGVVKSPESPKNVELSVNRYKIDLPERNQYQYIKIVAKNMGICPDWHPGAGGKAWIFADEITVE